jgi:hypothetical protein
MAKYIRNANGQLVDESTGKPYDENDIGGGANINWAGMYQPEIAQAPETTTSPVWPNNGVDPAVDTASPTKTPTAEKGLGTNNYVGYGLQLLGGLMAQNAQEKAQKKADVFNQAEIARNQKNLQTSREDALKQNADQLAIQQRQQNQSGMNMLQGIVGTSRQMGRRMSFADHLAKSAGY